MVHHDPKNRLKLTTAKFLWGGAMDDVTMLSWIDRARNISALLVALGVAGEFAGDWFASPIRKRLDEARQGEIARLNKEAGEARKAAGEAMERAEEEKLARLKIEEKLAPRLQVVSPEQQSRIILKLSAFKGYRADIGTFPLTFEGEMLARQIRYLLGAAHWSAEMMQAEASGPLGVFGSGVNVRATSDPRSIAAANALVEALRAEKIDAFVSLGLPGATAEARQDDPYIFRVLIVVGEKP